MEDTEFILNPPRLNLSDENDIPEFPCVYKSPDMFKDDTNDRVHGGSFSLLTFNVRSCRKNFASFYAFLCSLMFKFSVIVLVETWLSSDTDHSFDIIGYKQKNVYRDNYGGGIKVYYDEMLMAEVSNELTIINNIMEVLTLTVSGANFRYIVCCVYRSTGANPLLFNECFSQEIINRFPCNSNIIVTGDINLNLFNPLRLSHIDVFVDFMLAGGFYPVITIPAKLNANNQITQYSLIDQIWVNFKTGLSHDSGVLLFSLTDHFPIYYRFHNNLSAILKTIDFRLFSDSGLALFIQKVSDTCFQQVFECQEINDAFEQFHSKLFEIYDSSFPVKRKKIKSNLVNAPWVTPDVRKCIKKKYKLFNQMKRGLIHKRHFNVYKNTLRWVINKLKRQYYFNKFSNCKGNSKQTWLNINSLLHRGVRDAVGEVITEDGQLVKGVQMANYFNGFFTDIASRLTTNLPQGMNYEYFRGLPLIAESFFFQPTDMNEVVNILRSIPNKGNSLTDLKPSVLLLVSNTVGPLIAHIYNLGIFKGVYPDLLKVGRVVPVFKSGEATKVNNYRPITILSTINKVFETLSHVRMMKFIDRYGILSHLQYGFRKASNTTLAIFRVVSDWLKTFNKKIYTIALFLDLRKAFDTVDRDILLHKLSLYGFRGIPNSFLSSYLTNRKQYVDVDGHKSDTKPINQGVPQGSVLGPLLFNLFINDIVNIGSCEKVLFADDAVFYVTDESLPVCVDKLRLVISELTEWLQNNKLIPNLEKTKIMMLTPRPVGDLPSIHFSGVELEWVSSFKYLGVHIDNKLTFTFHVNEIQRKLSKHHGVFYSLSSLLPRHSLMTIYHSLVYPVLTQSIIIWGGVPMVHQRNIEILINKILRHILNVGYDANNVPLVSTGAMYKSLKLLKFPDVYKYFLLRFLHYALYVNPAIFREYFMPLLPTHAYSMRESRMNFPSTRLEIEKQFTIHQCCKLFNELPKDLLEPQCQGTLKAKFNCFTLNQY